MGTIFYYPHDSVSPLVLEIDAQPGTDGRVIQKTLNHKLGFTNNPAKFYIGSKSIEHLCWDEGVLTSGCLISAKKLETTGDALFTLRSVSGPDAGRAYPLFRGTYSIGKDQNLADLAFTDAALSPVHGWIDVTESGLRWSSESQTFEVELNSVLHWGNSRFVISQENVPLTLGHKNIELSPLAIELAPKRQSWVYLLMILMPLALGVFIASLTGMWLFLVMSLASSLMMGVHWLTSRGESKKATRALADGLKRDIERSQAIPSITQICQGQNFNFSSCPHILVGSGRRPALLEHRNLADYKVPFAENVPLAVPLLPSHTVLVEAGTALFRSVMLGLIAQNTSIVWMKNDYLGEFVQDVEYLLRVPGFRVIDDPDNIKAQDLLVLFSPLQDLGLPQNLPCAVILFSNMHKITNATDFDVVLKSAGHYQEKLIITGTEKDYSLWTCWADGISQDVFIKALSIRLGKSEHDASSLNSEVETHKIADFSRNNRLSVYSPDIEVFLGSSHLGPVTASLTADGPHWLIAGTTGSGKSQLLRTSLLSIALKYPPERIAFFLIDFKGGATLGVFSQLAHTSNVLTDLEGASVDRALRYLRADLHAREKEFQKLGVSSFEEYLLLHQQLHQKPSFPELLIAVDEFKMLVEELPQAMNELMKVATIGRSLGVHLLLATQRPQGAVSQDIRANIALSLCLRVSSAQDSHNVLGTEDAAQISSSTPGRGFIAKSGEKPIEFQAPLFTGVFEEFRKPILRLPNAKDHRINDLSQTLEEVIGQLAQEDRPTNYLPVPPELSEHVGYRKLRAPHFYLGESEIPELAMRESLSWNPLEDGSLALLAEPKQRTGLVASLFQQVSAQQLHIVCFAADALAYKNLREAEVNHKISTVVGPEDLEYCGYVLHQLLEGTSRKSNIFLLLDSLDHWLEIVQRHPDLENLFHRVLREGHRFGLRILATSSQPLRGKTQLCLSNSLWSAFVADKDPFKKSSKSFPLLESTHYAVEGMLLNRCVQGRSEYSVLAASSVTMEHALSEMREAENIFEPLPRFVQIQEIAQKPQEFLGKSLYWGTVEDKPVTLELQAGKFIPVVGSKSSGKTEFLITTRLLNPEWSFLYLSGKSALTQDKITQAISRVKHPEQTILLVDDLNYIDPNIQEIIISKAQNFASSIVTFTPWNRWHSSPILMGLQGCSRGIALMPLQKELEIFADAKIPANLKTRGELYPGRALLIDYFEVFAFQAPVQSIEVKAVQTSK